MNSTEDRVHKGCGARAFNDELAGDMHHWIPEPAEALAKKNPRHYKD